MNSSLRRLEEKDQETPLLFHSKVETRERDLRALWPTVDWLPSSVYSFSDMLLASYTYSLPTRHGSYRCSGVRPTCQLGRASASVGPEKGRSWTTSRLKTRCDVCHVEETYCTVTTPPPPLSHASWSRQSIYHAKRKSASARQTLLPRPLIPCVSHVEDYFYYLKNTKGWQPSNVL